MLTVLAGPCNGHPTLALQGELTIFTVTQAHQEILALWAGAPAFSLDLSELEELDSAGVQLLAWLKREAAGRGQTLAFLGHSPVVVEALDLLGITRAFGDAILLPPSHS